ncbi:MAG: DUF2723 domain-containing protein [Phycisphaerae bacterium]|jgi:hypothetical protein
MASSPPTYSVWIVPLAALAPLVAITLAQLPAGPCFDDSGDLQTAAATLGIGHPPGYPLYVLAGHLATRVLPVEPAFAVTLSAWFAGLTALLLTARLAARAAGPWLGAGAALLLSVHPSVRESLLAPEIYAPTLALLLGAAALLLAWRDDAQPGRLLLAILLAATAASSRPPVILMLPGLLLAAWRAYHGSPRKAPLRRRRIATLAVLALGCAALPFGLSFAYVLARDIPVQSPEHPVADKTPAHPAASDRSNPTSGEVSRELPVFPEKQGSPPQPYNYIEAVSRATGWPPVHDQRLATRLRRAWWLLSGEQFRVGVTRTGAQLAARFAVMRDRLMPGRVGPLWAVAALVGLVLVARRDHALGWTLAGLIAGNLAFLLLYDARGAAADALPALAAGAIGLAAAAHALLQFLSNHRRRLAAIVAASIAAAPAWFVHTRRPDFMHDIDASTFLHRLEFATLAPGTVIFATWRECTPLGYEQLVRARRTDVRILNVAPEAWPAELERLLSSRADQRGAAPPILLVRDIAPPPGFVLVEQRGVFELRPRP